MYIDDICKDLGSTRIVNESYNYIEKNSIDMKDMKNR